VALGVDVNGTTRQRRGSASRAAIRRAGPARAGCLAGRRAPARTYAERESIEAFLRLPTPQRLIVRDVIATYAKAHGAVEAGKS